MLFFDIETKANMEAVDKMPAPSAPGNYKNPVKIAEYIQDKLASMIDKAALDPDYGQVVAIGMKDDDKETHSILLGEDCETEKELLTAFWGCFSAHMGQSCGYNIIGFDLPYLLRRSFATDALVITPPDLRRYQTDPTRDLMQILYNWGTPKGLKVVCELYGIKNDLPELNGSMVSEMDVDTLRLYAESDVNLVYELHEKMKGIYF